MKISPKYLLACTVCAGLLTVGTGNARATVIDNEVVTGFDVQLVFSYTDNNGNIKKTRVVSKDLVNAISKDFGTSFKGDQIVYWDGDYYLMNMHNNLVENLTDDEVIYNDVYYDSSFSEKNGMKDSYKEAETGYIYELEFASDGYSNWDSSTIAFYNDYTAYTWTEIGYPVVSGKQYTVITEQDGFGGYGHDWKVSGDDDIAVAGTIFQNGSGFVTP